ncbi:MAG: sodium:solute symporter [Bacteroidales bacterium]
MLAILAGYFLLLLVIARLTSKSTSNETFFIGNRKSSWILVAYGMIGASISGVSLISVPGEVGNQGFAYFQLVLGYPLGYFFIAFVLMPVYYKLNLISIYKYLDQRFGTWTYHTGSALFFISQSIGASLRLFLAVAVLQMAFFEAAGIPFTLTVLITLLVIWLYTYRAGIKTIVWTDTLQTTFMILAVIFAVWHIIREMGLTPAQAVHQVKTSPLSNIFTWDWTSRNNFFKQFLSGAFIAIVMTGLDQNMMQKNLTCRNIQEAQKNMVTFSLVLIPVNLLFLTLGALLYLYIQNMGLIFTPADGFYYDAGAGAYKNTDQLFPLLSLKYLHPIAGVFFLIGIVSAAFSSADSAITALTTAFCVDFMKIKDQISPKTRNWVHMGVSLLIFTIIMIFKELNDRTVINAVFTIAGYTYGPLLAFFVYGLFTRRHLTDRASPLIALVGPLVTYFISQNSEKWFGGYKFGFELLLVNAFITFILLWLTSIPFSNFKPKKP